MNLKRNDEMQHVPNEELIQYRTECIVSALHSCSLFVDVCVCVCVIVADFVFFFFFIIFHKQTIFTFDCH